MNSKRQRRRWTPRAKGKVLAFYEDHGNNAAIKRFHISSAQIARWKRERDGPQRGEVSVPHRPRGNGGAPEEGDGARVQAAIVYLEKAARIALLDREKGRMIRLNILISMILLALSSLKGEDA
jgi:transposase-like protein